MRIKHNFDAYAAQALISTQGRADANETAAFARQLEFIYTQTYDILYPELKARLLLPVDNSVPTGAELFTYRSYDKVGTGAIINSFAGDFPTAQVLGKEFPQAIRSIGSSYEYSIQDIRAAAMGNLQLDMQMARAARRMIEDQIDTIACVGNSGAGLPGFSNAPNILSYTLALTGTGGVPTWAAKSSDAVVADLNGMSQSVFTNSNGIHAVDTLVLDPSGFAFLANRRTDTSNNQNSLLEYYLEQSPWIKNIEFWPKLSTAGLLISNGTTPAPRIMMYNRNTENQRLVIPQEFEQMAPQQIGMVYKVFCHARCGGVTVPYPKSIVYADGITG